MISKNFFAPAARQSREIGPASCQQPISISAREISQISSSQFLNTDF